MNDIHDLYMKASVEQGFACVDLYTSFLGYCESRGLTLDSLLADGVHPNDAGYKAMFELMLVELGIARPIRIANA